MEQLHRGQPQHDVYSCCPQVACLILFVVSRTQVGYFNVTFLNTYSHQTGPASISVWLRVTSNSLSRLEATVPNRWRVKMGQYAQLHHWKGNLDFRKSLLWKVSAFKILCFFITRVISSCTCAVTRSWCNSSPSSVSHRNSVYRGPTLKRFGHNGLILTTSRFCFRWI